MPERGLDGDGGRNSLPSLEARTLLATEEEVAAITAEAQRLRAQLRSPHPAQALWENEHRRLLAERGRDLALHGLRARTVTTPNSGYTGEVMSDGSVLIAQPGGLAAYNVALDIGHLDTPITRWRVEFYPHQAARNGHLGHGANLEGSFILTSVQVSAGAQPSDQVDPHGALAIRRITATAEHPEYPASAALDDPQDQRLVAASPQQAATTCYIDARAGA